MSKKTFKGTTPIKALAALAVVTALAVSGCSSTDTNSTKNTASPQEQTSSPAASGNAEAGVFPVTVKHALGEAVIKQEPQRIAVIGWTTPDIVAALGKVPVAVGKNSYGADSEGFFPWFRAEVEKLGGEMPEALPSLERGEIDFEELLDTAPDLILATYSGITAEDYARLDSIAPTVAYPETAWATPLEDNIRLVGEALGVPQRAQELQKSLNDTVGAAAQAHPEFQGVTFAYGTVPADDGTLLFNGPADTRVQLLEQLGLKLTPGISELADASGESSSFNVSLEEMADLQPQLFVTNVEEQAVWDTAISGSGIFANWAPVKAGAVVVTTDHAQTMSLSSPSPLSVPWGLTTFVDQLSNAVSKIK